MALINCSECGKEISDKATHCVYCGCPVENIESTTTSNIIKENNVSVIKCIECGEEVSDTENICIHCGYPIKNDNSIGSKIWIASIVIIGIILFLSFFGLEGFEFLFFNSLKNKLIGNSFEYRYYNNGMTATETYYFEDNNTGTLKTNFDLPSMFNNYDRHYEEQFRYTITGNDTLEIRTDVAITEYRYNSSTGCLVSLSNSNIQLCK